MALQFDLLETDDQRIHAGKRLVELVRESGYHISTGFVGTPIICDALCRAGAPDAAFKLLLQTGCPSWLYPVTMGATTIWERWDSLLPDGSVNPGEMTSFNHYALGAVVDWLQRRVAGLAPAAPGYRQMEIRPLVGGGLTFARARHKTPYGMAAAGWELKDGELSIEVTVPPNTSAQVYLPGQEHAPQEVGAGSHRWQYGYPAA
jgi:alpha-L-rhamnosidase